jgi:hypothetical protein
MQIVIRIAIIAAGLASGSLFGPPDGITDVPSDFSAPGPKQQILVAA